MLAAHTIFLLLTHHVVVQGRVKVIQFAMAKCPDTTSWTAHFNNMVMGNEKLRAFIDFEQSFVGGDIGEGPVDENNWMNCFHGESECDGHAIMLCAKELSNSSYDWFDMVVCMDGKDGLPGVTYNNSYSIPQIAPSCSAQVNLDWDAILACASSPLGAQLLHDSHYNTMNLFEAHGGYSPEGHGYKPPLIPNIWIFDSNTNLPTQYNNKFVTAEDPYVDLLQRICAAASPSDPDLPPECL